MSQTYNYGVVFNPDKNLIVVGRWNEVQHLDAHLYPKSIRFEGFDRISGELTEEASVSYMWTVFAQMVTYHKISPSLIHESFLEVPAYSFSNIDPRSTITNQERDEILSELPLERREEWRSI